MSNLTCHEQFRHHCEARALLWQIHDFDLHTAVDALERLRRELGIDTDRAQTIMARAFAAVRDDLNGWQP